MNATQIHTTRIKIVDTARDLFSKFGYDGTSIRDIAEQCDVNVAAVNYHFSNKENLYWEVIAESFDESARICRDLSTVSKDIYEFSDLLYDHFKNTPDLVRNTMKLLLSETLHPPKESRFYKIMTDSFGPPGGNFIADFLKRELKGPVDEVAILWGVKSIFGTIIHWSTMCGTAQFKLKSKNDPRFSPERIKKDVRHMVRATVEYLKSHSTEII